MGKEKVIYKDENAPVNDRVLDLISRMTLREKVGQLNQRLYGFNHNNVKYFFRYLMNNKFLQ